MYNQAVDQNSISSLRGGIQAPNGSLPESTPKHLVHRFRLFCIGLAVWPADTETDIHADHATSVTVGRFFTRYCYWRWPCSIQCRVHVTVRGPSVRLSRRSTAAAACSWSAAYRLSVDICRLLQPGRGQQITTDRERKCADTIGTVLVPCTGHSRG